MLPWSLGPGAPLHVVATVVSLTLLALRICKGTYWAAFPNLLLFQGFQRGPDPASLGDVRTVGNYG